MSLNENELPQDHSPPEFMTCEDVRDLLHMLVENELEDGEARDVLEHLASCKLCREALSQHIKLHGVLTAHMPWLGKLYYSPVRYPHH